jgi:hypothetical protein
MRFFNLAAIASLSLFAPAVVAERLFESNSLNSCQENSMFAASFFKLQMRPDAKKFSLDLLAQTTIEGNITFDVTVTAYGFTVVKQSFNACDQNIFCPMIPGSLPPLKLEYDLPPSAISAIPSIAYEFPDIDAEVKVLVNLTNTQRTVACIQADVRNGKTVNLAGVKWAMAIIIGMGLMSSAICNAYGHYNAAAHFAASTLSLLAYFQSQAMIGLTAVDLPPTSAAWTQNFQWTMGIINVGFLQGLFSWYQKSTGGTPTNLLNSLNTTSVQIMKRDVGTSLLSRSVDLFKRSNIVNDHGGVVVFGIQRAAFTEGIETTNLFMTSMAVFCITNMFAIIGVCIFKGIFDLIAKKEDAAANEGISNFRKNWLIILKGILYRITLIGFAPILILGIWEFTQIDSPALVVLAVFFILTACASLGRAAFTIFQIARLSISMHNNPAHILFSNPAVLDKWGFLYIQFRASAYYYLIPTLAYTLIRSVFIGGAQGSKVAQAVVFLIIEAAALIAASIVRPWMSKSIISFNIAIHAINFVNAIMVLILSDVFGAPATVNGIVGVALFVINAIFSLVLLLIIIITSIIAIVQKNPDTRYQVVKDDRVAFMKSSSALITQDHNTELENLGKEARLSGNPSYMRHSAGPSIIEPYGNKPYNHGPDLVQRTMSPFAHEEPPRSPGMRPSSPFLQQQQQNRPASPALSGRPGAGR